MLIRVAISVGTIDGLLSLNLLSFHMAIICRSLISGSLSARKAEGEISIKGCPVDRRHCRQTTGHVVTRHF